jgi:hypothetical protein
MICCPEPDSDVHGIVASTTLPVLRYRLAEMSGEPLPFRHGVPPRLRNEGQLGFKMVKWIQRIEFVESFERMDGDSAATTTTTSFGVPLVST